MKLKTTALVASVASVLAGQAWPQSTDIDVGKAIMGHEAFMHRCVVEGVERNVAIAIGKGEVLTEDDIAEYGVSLRKLCDVAYEGVNVCMEGGAAKADARISQFNALIAKKLSDPLTRASDYRAFLSLKEFHDWELAALQELMAGETNHCE